MTEHTCLRCGQSTTNVGPCDRCVRDDELAQLIREADPTVMEPVRLRPTSTGWEAVIHVEHEGGSYQHRGLGPTIDEALADLAKHYGWGDAEELEDECEVDEP